MAFSCSGRIHFLLPRGGLHGPRRRHVPRPAEVTYTPIASDIAADDHRIHIDSDDADGRRRPQCRAQRPRQGSPGRAQRDGGFGHLRLQDRQIAVKGSVDFEDPKLRVRSDTGSYDIDGAAQFQRGDLSAHGPQRPRLRQGHRRASRTASCRSTMCATPVVRSATRIGCCRPPRSTSIPRLQEGAAHNVTMRFKDVPIFYTPYISFPVGDERKSGLLFPSFGHSGSNGFELEVPYYFNLAPELRPDAHARPADRARRAAGRTSSAI